MFFQVLPLLLAIGGPPQAPPVQQPQTAQAPAPAPRPARKIYDETADARAQIAAAVEGAKADGIRVLVFWGANDDERCAAFHSAFNGIGATPEIAQRLRSAMSDEFRPVRVDVGHLDKNGDVARAYGAHLTAGALPQLMVLDSNGKLVAQQSSSAFASEPGAAAPFDAAKIAVFLEKNQAPPLGPAAPALKAAVEQGRREGKTIFVWFSAPW